MPINEASAKPRREKWPLAFDLAGVPRDNTERKAMVEQLRVAQALEETLTKEGRTMDTPAVVNRFASDNRLSPDKQVLLEQMLESYKNGGIGREIDLSKPVVAPYVFQEFPKMLYPKKGEPIIVQSKEEETVKLKQGFQLKPPPLPKAVPVAVADDDN